MPSLKPGAIDFLSGNLRAAQCVVPAAVAIANAVRIGEVLSMTWAQVLPTGQGFIRPEKHSRSRLIYLGFPKPEIVVNRCELERARVFPFDYKSVWKYAKQCGLGVKINGHINDSVTHSGRYSVAKAVAAQLGERAAGDVLGHRGLKSTGYYLGKENVSEERARKRAARLAWAKRKQSENEV